MSTTNTPAAEELSPNLKDASAFTKAANQELARGLDFENTKDFADAAEDCLATWDPLNIKSEDGKRTVWTLTPYKDQVYEAPAPLTVNPSLWRQSKLNRTNGLFQVCKQVFQVRAFDMSNMTIIEGDKGLIIIDPLISCECAADALKLYRRHTGSHRKVKAVIFTHSHVDHFGGVLGVVSPEDVLSGDVQIVAPEGFLEHAVSENVYAGIAMSRRAQYMYGPYLEAGHRGQVDGGLGKGQSVGKVSIAMPTTTVRSTGETLELDGLEIEFHMTPGAEAPAEFDFYFPKLKAFCAAENAVHTMHNIQTLRGAKVRDALLWSKYMNETLERFGDRTDVLFASHHWPIWDNRRGAGNVARFLTQQRDMYRYLNDQTLRMLNKGYTGVEIAEVFEMPPALAKEWSCRGYYGSVNHNVKAVYDRYMGWFDGNPSNLHPLPPQQSSPKYVELMGGPSAVIQAATTASQRGEYRWAAELLNKLIFADPSNKNAKLLQADVLEQLGYQAEAATWRNFYLMGAQELRFGVPVPEMSSSDPSMTAAMTMEMIFDAIASHINGPQANVTDEPIVINWIFANPLLKSGASETYLVDVSNGAMSTTANRQSESADVTVTLERATLDSIMSQEMTLQQAIDENKIRTDGSIDALIRFFSLIDTGVPDFPIVTPRPDINAAWTGGGAAPKGAMATDEVSRRKLKVLGRLPRGC